MTLWALGAALPVAAPASADAPGLATLFRAETTDAPARLRWKGPALDDDTRLALAVSGVSWTPVAPDGALLRPAKKRIVYAPAAERTEGFSRARQAGDEKAAAAFALSLALDPQGDREAWSAAAAYLAHYDADYEQVLVGILKAPDRVPLLPTLQYAAADALVQQATSRTLPLAMTMAESSDRYLRSRAVAALGVIAYRARPGAEARLVGRTLEESSVSSVQQRMMAEVVRRAAQDKNHRVRAAAALALGLMGDEASVPLLEKMARDRAYLAFAEGDKDTRRVVYPVREQAAASLERFGKRVDVVEGVFTGKALKQATRGGDDVTKDRGDMRSDQAGCMRCWAGEW